MDYLYSLTVALFLTIALIPVMIRLAAPMGLTDDPGAERKVHSEVMPRTGGLGIIIGVLLPLLFLLPMDGYFPHLFIGCGIIIVFGLLDDRLELSYKWKLFGQALAAVVVMSGGIVLHEFPFLGLSEAPLWLTYPVTFLFLVGVVNGVNFSDGLDGLAAGTSMMALLLIFALALQSGNDGIALVSLTLVGGTLGFLRYNTFPANVFMGDAGSQFLGFVIACLAIAVTQGDLSPYSVFLPVLILGIPIMDILQVVPVRQYKKLPLPGPDKEHFHHQLGKLGFRHTQVVATIYVLQGVLLAGAYLLRYESDWLVSLFYANFVVLVLGCLLIANYRGWTVIHKDEVFTEITDRRNQLLRRFSWYYLHSVTLIAALLGAFFVGSGLFLADARSTWTLPLIVLLVSMVSGLMLLFSPARAMICRVVLYSASVFIGYFWVNSDPESQHEYVLWGFLSLLVVCLVLAIRMTRKKEFSLTTQDLLILIVLVLVPLLPGNWIGEYEVGRMALIVAVLMYSSEYVLNRAKSMTVVASVCAAVGLSLLLNI
ncbi:MAG: MraY family glycosyltransferase [Halioglobus sp.]